MPVGVRFGGANPTGMPFPKGVAARAVPDRELVIAFKAGDPDAYDEMYRRYSRRVMGVCSRMLLNRSDAEEAAQETFLRAYKALPRFNGNYKLGAWLVTIATNVSLDQLRVRNKTNLVALPSEYEALGLEESPEDEISSGDPRLDVALSNLRPIHARALTMRAVEELSHEEIAGRLEMTAPQVKALLHRARASFKRAWLRAEAMSFVPLLALRNRLHRSHPVTESVARVSFTMPAVAPHVAEKIAASAIAVVTAIGTMGVSVDQTRPAPRPVAASSQPAPKRMVTAPIETSTASKATPATAEDELSNDVGSVLDDAERVITAAPDPTYDPRDDDDDPGDGDGGLLGPGAQDANHKVEQVRSEVDDLLP